MRIWVSNTSGNSAIGASKASSCSVLNARAAGASAPPACARALWGGRISGGMTSRAAHIQASFRRLIAPLPSLSRGRNLTAAVACMSSRPGSQLECA